MKARFYGLFALRGAFILFFLLTSLYCLLAYIPFTYQQVHKGRLIPALNQFGEWQHVLYWLVLALIVPVVREEGRENRRRGMLYLLAMTAGGLLILVLKPLANPQGGLPSYLWSLAALAPVAGLAAIDLQKCYSSVAWGARNADEQRALFGAAFCSAMYVVLLFGFIANWRDGSERASTQMFALGKSAMSHLMVFMGFFVVLNLCTVIASWFRQQTKALFFLCHLLGAAVLWLVFRLLVFPTVGFTGPLALIYSLSFSFALSMAVAGISLQRFRLAPREVPSGLALALWLDRVGLPDNSRWRLRLGALAILIVSVVTAALAINTAKMDWNFLFQKLTTLVAWVAVFRVFYGLESKPRVKPTSTGLLLCLALLSLAAYRSFEMNQRLLWRAFGQEKITAEFLDRHAGFDVSFKLVSEALAPPPRDDGFYRFLAQSTNIPRSLEVKPVSVDLVDQLAAAPGRKPNVFLIVIDSLRRDYLAPYNRNVGFTPNIGQFARESIVMENAFTRYGATGLSEPSIWVGGMMLHKQYVTPFAPMNSLQKLLEADKYQSFISRDVILQTVVSPFPGLVEMDKDRGNMDYDLCSSLEEAQGKIEQAATGPMFLYTQSQNIHISVINRQGAKPIDAENYRGFYPPYASRLRRMDGCFGKFIGFLKARGLYDSSIVILTADHGDSLGEQGRWGHAYTIYPEILRIPLLIHLPADIRQAYQFDTGAVAFSTDIASSLYYLLGHRPIKPQEMFGRPLFTERIEEQAQYRRESYLVASSYAPVYGSLSGDGRSLFVTDAVNYKDYAFDLTANPPAAQTVTSSMRAENQKLIRRRVTDIGAFFHFAPGESAHSAEPKTAMLHSER